MKYCNGRHLCQICDTKYRCYGESMSHSGGTGNGRCHGEYTQFCPNHSINQYIAQHKLNGEL
jgi:hypothetical protein